MKNKIIVVMMALMIVGLMAGSAAASDWEAIGGMAITEVTLDKWNATIDKLNTNFLDENATIPTALGQSVIEVEKMDNIDRVPIVYLGAQKALNENWDGTIRYEYIFGGVEGSAYIDGKKHTAETDVDLHGVAFLADYNLNDHWSLGGGLGFYRGSKSKKVVGDTFGFAGVAQDEKYDLDAVSYRLGVAYERPFAKNWNVNAALGYIYMEIDDQEEGNVYSKGFSYSLGVEYSF